MAIMLERLPTAPEPELEPEPPRPRQSANRGVPEAAVPAPAAPPPAPIRTARRRTFWDRYQQHVLIGLVSALGLGAALLPTLLAPAPKIGGPAQVGAPATSLPTSITITAAEFTFNPTSVKVPLGQKVTVTLKNTGVVEHDVTIPAAGFSLAARPGQTATREFTFTTAGVFEVICSVAGHKEAGMKGTLTVVDPAAGGAPQAQPAHDMAGMAGMGASAAAPDIRLLPANLAPLAAPTVAPPITRAESAYVKFDLETTRVTATLADGVAYEYWTFNNTVPGPMLRVREGDTVEIDLHNAADAGVTHSIDLHAVTGPGGGARVMQLAPGEHGSFRFEALNPGVYVYHCATPMVAQHIASGMYGLIVVEPKAGLPKVDHEFYLMQGDFYLQGQRGDQGLRAFDLPKMLDERPDYVLFNGRVGALTGDNALRAKVGETVRLFFGVGGPNLTSSLHVIGEVFDRVYPEGALANPLANVQTTLVPAGGAAVAEFKLEVPGTYTIVDHSLGRLEKGAAAQIVVEGPSDAAVFESLEAGSGGGGGH